MKYFFLAIYILTCLIMGGMQFYALYTIFDWMLVTSLIALGGVSYGSWMYCLKTDTQDELAAEQA